MSSPVDPVGTEIEGIHELVYFSDAYVLAGGAGMGMTWRYADEAATVLAIDMNGRRSSGLRRLSLLRSAPS